jgi:hypothetical protein
LQLRPYLFCNQNPGGAPELAPAQPQLHSHAPPNKTPLLLLLLALLHKRVMTTTRAQLAVLLLMILVCVAPARSQWSQLGRLGVSDVHIDHALSDYYPTTMTVRLDAVGNTAVVGVSNAASGHAARVMAYANGSWLQRGGDLDADDGSTSSLQDVAVDISADGLTVLTANVGANNYAGRIRVYTWRNAAWVRLGSDIRPTILPGASTPTFAGMGNVAALSLDAQVVVASVGFGYSGGNVVAQVFRAFAWNSSVSEWVQRGNDVSKPSPSDYPAGISASSNGSSFVTATLNYSTGAQTVVTHEWRNGSWAQRGSIMVFNGVNRLVLMVLSLSADGNVWAVATTGGEVYVYEWGGELDWERRGQPFESQGSSGDYTTVSLSADGARLAIGRDGGNGVTLVSQAHYRLCCPCMHVILRAFDFCFALFCSTSKLATSLTPPPPHTHTHSHIVSWDCIFVHAHSGA